METKIFRGDQVTELPFLDAGAHIYETTSVGSTNTTEDLNFQVNWTGNVLDAEKLRIVISINDVTQYDFGVAGRTEIVTTVSERTKKIFVPFKLHMLSAGHLIACNFSIGLMDAATGTTLRESHLGLKIN